MLLSVPAVAVYVTCVITSAVLPAGAPFIFIATVLPLTLPEATVKPAGAKDQSPASKVEPDISAL